MTFTESNHNREIIKGTMNKDVTLRCLVLLIHISINYRYADLMYIEWID